MCPVVNPHTEQSANSTTLFLCLPFQGYAASTYAFPCLSAVLPDDIFIDALRNSLNIHDAFVIEDVFERVKQSTLDW